MNTPMQAILFGFFALMCSGLLMLVMAILVAVVVSNDLRERFWVAIASIALQLGTVSTLASLASQLNPMGWILIQAGISLFILLVLGQSKNLWPALLELRRKLGKGPLVGLKRSLLSSSPSKFWLSCVILVLVLSCTKQWSTPISGFDDRMYHASRVAYWVQNQSIFPYVTHNDRQTVFSFGSELYFLWPLLFTKCEVLGRLVFWLGFPISALGLYSLIRELQLSRTVAMGSMVAFLATPIIFWSSLGLNPEMWLSVFVLGAAFWIARAARQPASAAKSWFFAGLNVAIALGVKFTVLPMALFLIVAPFLAASKSRSTAMKYIMGGILLGVLTSGLVVPFGFNEREYGNPFGPAAMRRAHTSELSLIQIYTHTVRLPFLLWDFPLVPSKAARDMLTRFGNGVISALGAARPLDMETSSDWPGRFTFVMPEQGRRYSLGGMLWLPILAVAFVLMVREAHLTFPKINLSPLSLLLFIDALLLAGIVYLSRWQAGADIPDRFLVAPFALAIAIAAVVIDKLARQRKVATTVSVLLVISIAAVPVVTEVGRVQRSITRAPALEQCDEPFGSALNHVPSGSHILLIANQNARDYPLFNPRAHYCNRVTPWGKSPFDSERMRVLIQNDHITHILLQDDQQVEFHWAPSLRTVEMANWLAEQSYLREIPLAAPGMRLFARAE